jgi:hypothetical protein
MKQTKHNAKRRGKGGKSCFMDDDDDGGGFEAVMFARPSRQVFPTAISPNGTEFTVKNVLTTDSIASLKRSIGMQVGLSEISLDLFLAESELPLENEWKISACKIETDTQLFLFNAGEDSTRKALPGEDVSVIDKACQEIENGMGVYCKASKFSAATPNCVSIWGGGLGSSTDLQQLAEALEANTQITVLDISNNLVRDAGAEILARTLATNTTLEIVYLNGTGITIEGAISVASALYRNRRSKLKAISLDPLLLRSAAVEAAFDKLSQKDFPQTVALVSRDADAAS